MVPAWRTAIRLDPVRSVNKILDGLANVSVNTITLIGPRSDNWLE